MTHEHKKQFAIITSVIGVIGGVIVLIQAAFAYDNRVELKIAENTTSIHQTIEKTNKRLDALIIQQNQAAIKSAVRELGRIEYLIRNELANEYDLIRKHELEELLDDLRNQPVVTLPVEAG